jgi:hypothetical protein
VYERATGIRIAAFEPWVLDEVLEAGRGKLIVCLGIELDKRGEKTRAKNSLVGYIGILSSWCYRFLILYLALWTFSLFSRTFLLNSIIAQVRRFLVSFHKMFFFTYQYKL